jgi:DtxR family Mn-dependent transcriptional regulator
MDLSPQIQDYLKNIYQLQSEHPQVPTTALAERLGVSAPTVSSMMRKLAELGLATHQPYKGVHLTPEGEKLALGVLRAHRLCETYLVRVLGFSWDEAHVEAERIEHALSEKLVDRLEEALDYPASDPHGHPIPTRDGQVPCCEGEPLAALEPGESGAILQIKDDSPKLLRYLGELGLYPGEMVEVLEVAPFSGPIHLRVGDTDQVVGREVAEHVIVQTGTDSEET